jgi:sarcosine oxidase subunit beta
VVIIGGGGHGLATAYYLAKNHGITNVAVLEKGYLGSAAMSAATRPSCAPTTCCRQQRSTSHSMKLWEGLEQDLNYNVMHSQRGVINLFHSDGQRDAFARRGNAMRLQGVDAELLTARGARSMPFSISTTARFPIYGGLCSRAAARRGMTRWPGAMRAAPTGAASTSSRTAKSPASTPRGRQGVTSASRPRAARSGRKVGIAVAGNSSQVAAMAGMRCRSKATSCRPS